MADMDTVNTIDHHAVWLRLRHGDLQNTVQALALQRLCDAARILGSQHMAMTNDTTAWKLPTPVHADAMRAALRDVDAPRWWRWDDEAVMPW